ncbi:hypothetical protein EIN_026620 [Entamoeba invadens IP1]|uniref:hypothetical protein n=1 Tax=Entamoeba invadens IP1 TaxID=370355 RepID=UPI0002C3F4F0|nr:hypothetical protein EIN_026620 [Entamoeba invadens IP1]ELP90793.1 hypothetical protein EIN_026620 [Entamoeba invadens IP1]|eukprot:XP_004257564.1 hypothetical protein EIN_026620 [Entamoeba invadens IP1]
MIKSSNQFIGNLILKKNALMKPETLVADFPFFSPKMNVSSFVDIKDDCNKNSKTNALFIPVAIPPNKVFRVSTCNRDTTVKTSISMTCESGCLRTRTRPCKYKNGTILEFLPSIQTFLKAKVRIGAERNVPNGKVRVTLYTVDRPQRAKVRRTRHASFKKAKEKKTAEVIINKSDLVPVVKKIEKRLNTTSNYTPKRVEKEFKITKVDLTQSNGIVQTMISDIEKMSWWVVAIFVFLFIVLLLVVGLVLSGTMNVVQQEQHETKTLELN